MPIANLVQYKMYHRLCSWQDTVANILGDTVKEFPGQIATFPGTLTDKFGGRKIKMATRNTLEISEI